MSGDVLSEVGDKLWSQRARARVSEWLNNRFGNSDVTSGVGSMSAAASYVEKMDEGFLTDDSHQPMTRFFPEKDKMESDMVLGGGVSTDTVVTKRRRSF